MVAYSLHSARLTKDKERKERWPSSIRMDFSKRLDRKTESSLEFSVTLGKYLSDLYYLDEEWVMKNVDRIFPLDDEGHWEAAFTGYLAYSHLVRREFYSILREHGHYHKAGQTEFSSRHITERLVQHICIGYIEGWEDLADEESLIIALLRNENVEQLSAIVSFFSLQGDKLTDKMKTKVKPLWKTLFDILAQDETNPDNQILLSKLSLWLTLIEQVDEETLRWLRLSAKYVHVSYNTASFIEYLLKHAHRKWFALKRASQLQNKDSSTAPNSHDYRGGHAASHSCC